MKRVIISDTSCLIVLSKIGCLHILQTLFGEALIEAITIITYNEEKDSVRSLQEIHDGSKFLIVNG